MEDSDRTWQLNIRELTSLLKAPDQFVANLLAGIIVSLVAIIFNISYAALIFSGPLAPYLPFGISAALISLAASAIVVALFSSLPILCAGPDSLTAAVIALLVGNIAHVLVADGATEALLPTTIIAFVMSASLTGLVLLFAGQIQLGKWVRYIPYPVIGGFLAGTGWLISRGAIKVMSGIPVEFSQLDTLLQLPALLLWLPGLSFGLMTLAITRRYKHYLVIPALFVIAIVLFYGALWIIGMDRQEAVAMGLLFEPFADTAYRYPLTASMLTEVHWSILWAQSATLLALFLITIIDLLLVASGLELALETNIDFNRELRITGTANVVSGFFGGFVACLSTSRTLLNAKAGATNRLSGLVVAAVGLLMLIYGGPLVAYIPKAVLGGLLLYLGASLLVRWLYESRQKLSWADYGLIWIILLTMGLAGLLPGIAAGIVIASIIFTITYSRTPIFKHELSGADYPSNRARTFQQRRYLSANGDKIRILWLQGYLFFGTATQLAEYVQQLIDARGETLQFLILDFYHVSGVDTSALTSFTKLQRLAQEHNIQLLYTSLLPELLAQFKQEKIVSDQSEVQIDSTPVVEDPVDLLKIDISRTETNAQETDQSEQRLHPPSQRLFKDLDHGVEWCEEQLLESTLMYRQRFFPLAMQLDELFSSTEQVTAFMGYLERSRAKSEETLISVGQPSTTIYILEHGQVSIFTQLPNGQKRRVSTLGSGAIFGDWSVPANGYVVTDQRCQLYTLSDTALERMEADEPALAVIFFRFIAQHTGEHLLQINTTIDRLLS